FFIVAETERASTSQEQAEGREGAESTATTKKIAETEGASTSQERAERLEGAESRATTRKNLPSPPPVIDNTRQHQISDMTTCLNDLRYIPLNNEQNEPTQEDIGKTSNDPTQVKRNEFEELYASANEELYLGCDYVTRLDFMESFKVKGGRVFVGGSGSGGVGWSGGKWWESSWQENLIEEAMTGVMTELILRECIEKAPAKSSLVKPKINDNMKIELSKEHIKKLRNNVYSGTEEEDMVDHIAKLLEIRNLIKTRKMDTDQLRMYVFPFSLTDATRKWWKMKGATKSLPGVR
nr:hypothetical protein [Tanacetum cinerariifolium]